MSVGHLIAGILIALVGICVIVAVGAALYFEVELPGSFSGKHDKSELQGSGALGFGALGLFVFCFGVITATNAASSSGTQQPAASPSKSPARTSAIASPTAMPSAVPPLPPPGPGPWAASSNGVRVVIENAAIDDNGLERLSARIENDGGFRVSLAGSDVKAVDGKGRTAYFSTELSSLLEEASVTGITLAPGRSVTGTLVTLNPLPSDTQTLEVRFDIRFGGSNYVHFPVRTAIPR